MSLAPIILFVHSRAHHARQTIEALEANDLASKSDLIVYADGSRSASEDKKVEETRKVISENWNFRSVTLIERPTNLGLAENIIQGVSEVLKLHGKAIILEDDVLAAPFFLRFMNDALNRYEPIKKIWHINGWNCPMPTKDLPNVFSWRLMHCWGWATWLDRWTFYDRSPERLISGWSANEIRAFNLDGAYDFFDQVIQNHVRRINTWAIFWYASIFERNGLCISPSKSLTKNIGLDGTGENCSVSNAFQTNYSDDQSWNWPIDVKEEILALNAVKDYYLKIKSSYFQRLLKRLFKYFF